MKKLLLLVACIGFTASASADILSMTGSSDTVKTPSSGGPLPPPSGERTGTGIPYPTVDIPSWDLVLDPDNAVVLVDVGAALGVPGGPATMNGIGWDVTLEAVGTSWLSELRVYFDDNIAPDLIGLFLRPGVGSNFPGVGSFSSGGVIKLADAGIPDILLPDGILRLEFHETFDDVANAIDGYWRSGSLTIQAIPEPASMLLLALGGLALIRRR